MFNEYDYEQYNSCLHVNVHYIHQILQLIETIIGHFSYLIDSNDCHEVICLSEICRNCKCMLIDYASSISRPTMRIIDLTYDNLDCEFLTKDPIVFLEDRIVTIRIICTFVLY